MAPGTNLGAASPVCDRRVRILLAPKDRKEGERRRPGRHDDAQGDHDAVAYIRSLAQLRGRNADWGEKAVREAVSLPAEEALKLKVIDVCRTGRGGPARRRSTEKVKLQTRSKRSCRPWKLDWRTRLLAVITNPSVA